MKYVILLFFIFSGFGCRADNTAVKTEIDVLRNGLGNEFSKIVQGEQIEYRYCPDNTCIEFIGKVNNQQNLDRFVLFYLYYVSGYAYLKIKGEQGNFFDNAKSKVEDIITSEKFCSGSQLHVASCILNKLAVGVSAYYIRIDEHGKNRINVDIKTEISESNLEKVSEWRKELPDK